MIHRDVRADAFFRSTKIGLLIAVLAGWITMPSYTHAASEIGNRCKVVSDSIPFSQRKRGDSFHASAVFTKRLMMNKGEKTLILGTLRSTAPSKDESIDKMLFGALLASFEERPDTYQGHKTGQKTYKISTEGELSRNWHQISPALAYNVSRDTNKYGVINLHSLYQAEWTGEHWITLLGYAAHTRPVEHESIPVSSHQRACDLIAIKLD